MNTADRATLRSLAAFTVLYCAASLLHFVHNAVFLDAYPNMPAWISAAGVYATWVGITAIGIVGCLLVRFGHALVGLIVVGVYAGFGFDGFAHYGLAPPSAHTAMMNLTIWLEAATAALLLIAVAALLIRQVRAGAVRPA